MTLKGIQSFFISKDLIFFFLSEHSLKIVYNLLLKGELVRCYHSSKEEHIYRSGITMNMQMKAKLMFSTVGNRNQLNLYWI